MTPRAFSKLTEGDGQPGFDVPIDPIEGNPAEDIRKVFMACEIEKVHAVARDQEIEAEINWSDEDHARSEVWDLVFKPLDKDGEADELVSMARSYGLLESLTESTVTTASGNTLTKVTDEAVIAKITQLAASDSGSFNWYDSTDLEFWDEEQSDALPMAGSGEVWQDEAGRYWYFESEVGDAVGVTHTGV